MLYHSAQSAPRPVKSWKPTPQTRCQATRSICVNWEYREKRDGALLIIESGNGSAGWLGVEALRSVYLGASSRSWTLSPPHSTLSSFLPALSVLAGPRPPSGWRVWPLGFWRMGLGRRVLAGAGASLLLMVESGLQKSNSSEKAGEPCERGCPSSGALVALLKYRGPRREASVG